MVGFPEAHPQRGVCSHGDQGMPRTRLGVTRMRRRRVLPPCHPPLLRLRWAPLGAARSCSPAPVSRSGKFVVSGNHQGPGLAHGLLALRWTNFSRGLNWLLMAAGNGETRG